MNQTEILKRLVIVANALDSEHRYAEANEVTEIAVRVANSPQLNLNFSDKEIPFDPEWHGKIASSQSSNNGFTRTNGLQTREKFSQYQPISLDDHSLGHIDQIQDTAERVSPNQYIQYCECGEPLKLHGARNSCRGCGRVRDIKGQPFSYALAQSHWEEHLRKANRK